MIDNDKKKIVRNTLMLYAREVFNLLISLYTVRVVLNTLGVEDYGIYTVVGGIVSLFSFLTGAMASATQRFFSFALGEKNIKKLNEIFTINIIIYLSISVIAFILLETLGLWFVYEYLKIPIARFDAAVWVYHFSVLTFMASILVIPFRAIIISHEDMHIYAYLSIVESILRLGIVFLLVFFDYDKLKLYSILIFILSVIIAFFYIIICIEKYQECKFKKNNLDKRLFHEIINYTKWTLFGQLTTIARNQGVTILLNQMFNPAVVAAKAISTNISGQVNIFANNFNTGLYPPIIKSYSSGNKDEMFSLIINGSKITFFLMWIFALPFFMEMEVILNLWLKHPPDNTVLFTKLALIEVVINAACLPIQTAARAPGKVKFYELTLGTIQLSIFFISWFVLAVGGKAYTVFVVAIIINLIMFAVRLLIVRKLISLSLRVYFLQVLKPMLLITCISTILSLILKFFLPAGLVFSLITILISMILVSVNMYFIGLNKQWQEKIRYKIFNYIKKLSWRN